MKSAIVGLMAFFTPFCCFGEDNNGRSFFQEADSVVFSLDELNITAIKQIRNFGQEAEASTVLTQSQIEQLGANTMRGFSDVVPNFYMPDYGSRITSTIYVRGIGARMDQPSVGLNVDNVPYLNKDAYDFDIEDIANVEILRGPQSVLYGRNTMAGVINISTLSPLSFQGWRLLARIGSAGRYKASAGWYHKFNYKTGISITADYSHLDGYFINNYNGQKIDKENNVGGRLKFKWLPSDKITLLNTASFGFLRQGGYPYEYIESGEINYNDTCFYHRFTFADGLSLNYVNERFTLTSITSLQHIDDNMTLDQDFLPLDYFTLSQKKKETAVTEEVVLKGKVKSKYDWITGLFGFYKHLRMDAPVTFKDVGIGRLIEDHRNEANPNYPIEWDSRAFQLNSKFTIPTFGMALYHESALNISNFEFSAALRMDYEKSTLDYHSFCSTGYKIWHLTESGKQLYREVPIDIDDHGNLSKDFITLLPRLSISYNFDSMPGNVYFKFSKGYKAGGFNTQMFSDVLQQRLMNMMGIGSRYDIADVVSYKPEQSWNYELGSHFCLLKRKLDIEAILFYIDCQDQQLTMFPDGTTTGRIMTNAGKTRSYGAELSLAYAISEKMICNISYGYTNARFRQFFDGINDYKGKFLPYVPANTLYVQGLWTVFTNMKSGISMLLDVNLRGTGKIYWDEGNTLSQDFYVLLGASATLKIKNIEFKLWGKNLSDTSFYTFYFKSMGNEFLQRGRGIEGGIDIRWVINN